MVKPGQWKTIGFGWKTFPFSALKTKAASAKSKNFHVVNKSFGPYNHLK